eukprot:scaffold178349_cov68-Cyclotella_meneghiniana.AAC.1
MLLHSWMVGGRRKGEIGRDEAAGSGRFGSRTTMAKRRSAVGLHGRTEAEMMRGHAVERTVHYGRMTVLGGGRGGHSKHVRLIAHWAVAWDTRIAWGSPTAAVAVDTAVVAAAAR